MTSLAHSVAGFGDSRMRSSSDATTVPQGQGDYLSGTSPTAPYINIGNYAWFERGIAGLYPYVNFSVQGKTAVAYTAALMPKELAILDKAPPTHAVIGVGINDLMTGATATSVENRLKAIMAMLRGRYPGIICYVATIPPVSNSSDNWATLGNQFLSGTLPNGVTPTWANFTDNTHTSGLSLLNYRIRNALLGADGFIEIASVCAAVSDERLWQITATRDGIHQNQVYHTLCAAAVDANALFG